MNKEIKVLENKVKALSIVVVIVSVLSVIAILAPVYANGVTTIASTVCMGIGLLLLLFVVPCIALYTTKQEDNITAMYKDSNKVSQVETSRLVADRMHLVDADVLDYINAKGLHIHFIDKDGYVVTIDNYGHYVNQNTIKMLLKLN